MCYNFYQNMANPISLTQDAWLSVFLYCQKNTLYQLSQVCKLFDEIFYERYPWNDEFSNPFRFNDHQISQILRSASEKNYLNFLIILIRHRRDLESELNEAGNRGDAVLVRAFFKSGVDCLQSYYHQALTNAAYHGHVAVAHAYIDNGYQGDLIHVIKIALKQQNIGFVKSFVESGVIGKEKISAILFQSIQNQDLSVTKSIVDQNYCSPGKIQEILDQTPDSGPILIQAAGLGLINILEQLIQSPSCSEMAYNEAFVEAAKQNQQNSLQFFINQHRFTAEGAGKGLIAAAGEGHLNIVLLLIQTGKCQPTALRLACSAASRNHHLPIINILIPKLSKEDFRDPLEAAAKNGHPDVLSALIQGRDQPLSFEETKQLAILAIKNSHLSVIDSLKDVPHFENITSDLFKIAIDSNALEIVRNFLERAWVQTILFDTILNPVKNGYHQMVKLLLESPLFPALAEQESFTLFTNAFAFFHIPVIEILFQSQAFDKIASSLKSIIGTKLNLLLKNATERESSSIIHKLNPDWYNIQAKSDAFKTAIRSNQTIALKALLKQKWIEAVSIQDVRISLQRSFQDITIVLIDHCISLTSEDYYALFTECTRRGQHKVLRHLNINSSSLEQMTINLIDSKNLSCEDYYAFLTQSIQRRQLQVLQHLIKHPLFDQMTSYEMHKVALLSRSAENAQVFTYLLNSRRGYEFSNRFLYRCYGKFLLWLRWISSFFRKA